MLFYMALGSVLRMWASAEHGGLRVVKAPASQSLALDSPQYHYCHVVLVKTGHRIGPMTQEVRKPVPSLGGRNGNQ